MTNKNQLEWAASTLLIFVAMNLRRIIQSVPYKPSPHPAKLLPTADLVEEERTPHYKPQHFYPVRLYEILNN